MYVANTHLKPVIGIDIHFVNMPFPFVPMPHPYIGLVIDPFDYIPFIGATIKVNGVPRGNTDTMGMIITFVHIPFGAGFTIFPIIGHDSQNFFGSKRVMADGAPMSGAGYMVMTCNDIGLPLSFRPGKKFKPIPSLYLPTSFCIPLQWGPPVNVGGPLVPNFSLMSLLRAFAFGSFLKVLGKAGGKMLRALNNKLAKKFPSTQKLSKKLCKMGFEPVDLVTGRVNYEYTDFELPGPIPIRWTRNWDSDSQLQGLLGHGTQLCYDRFIELMPEEDGLVLMLADGRVAAFPLLLPGEEFYHTGEKLLLKRKQNGHFLLDDYNESLYYHFNHPVSEEVYRLSFIENYSGSRVQFHYQHRQLHAITDSAGRRLLLQLDKYGRITKVEVKHRNILQTLVSYGYNQAGDLVTISDALNQDTVIEYRDHLMTRKTDRNGQSFYWEYDQERRCMHTGGDGGVLEGWIEYLEDHNLVTNSVEETTTYWYDENNLCTQETDHYGNHRYTEYTDDFEIYREIDEQGNITGYTYDDRGLLKEKVFPDGNGMQFHYTAYNKINLVVYPDGSSETYGYDDMRRLRFVNYPNGQTTSYQYNDEGQVAAVLQNGKQQTGFAYDEDENLAEVQFPNGGTAHWKYDAFGRCVQSMNPEGQLRHYEYDELNRVRNMYLPDGNTIRLDYNAYEEVVHIADKHSDVQFEYTPLGSVRKRRQNKTELNFLYDTEERLRSVVNEAGKYYRFGYNKRGEVIRETGFDGIERKFERDIAGKIIKTERPGDKFTLYEYDANGRIIRAEYHDGSWELFRYDKNGNLAEAINEFATIRLGRNKMGKVELEQQDSYSIKSSYDKYGNRTGITSSLGADIQIKRNELGQATDLQATMQPLLWTAQYRYNRAGQETERLLPGGIKSEKSYDHAGRPGEHKVTRNSVVQSWKKYTWDANDRLTEVFDALAHATMQFKHNAMGNLVFAQYADDNIVYRYTDETGNIYETREKKDRKYNSAGALLESKTHVYKYDEEGNLISKTGKLTGKKTGYEWYASGMLKKVVRPDGKPVEFKYDALGRRTEKCFAGTITRYVWDGNTLLHEWTYNETERPQPVVNEWGDIQADKPEPVNELTTWVFEADSFVPAAKIAGGQTYSIVADYLGTPQLMFDSGGRNVWEGVLDIYGRVRTLTGDRSSLPFRYQGQYEDAETGLYYNRFRYYSPDEGIYVSQDPIGLNGNNPTIYGYVNDPNREIDFLGLNPTPAISNSLKALAEAHVNNSGVTVLGHYRYPGITDFETYIDKAKRLGASYYDIGDMWNKIPEEQRWKVNEHFIDVIADKEDKIIFNVPKRKIRVDTDLEREVAVLKKKGYKWVNQWSMRKKCP